MACIKKSNSVELKKCQDNISSALDMLLDFQNANVDYCYRQLYEKNIHKMLVADEVGLGKTLVAKGVIARAFRKYLLEGNPSIENPTFNVVYICSNLTLARQNIARLNIMNDDNYVSDNIDRLTLLAYETNEKRKIFSINSLTPGTSFHTIENPGTEDERKIIYSLLIGNEELKTKKNQLWWLLRDRVSKDNWGHKATSALCGGKILKKGLSQEFIEEIKKNPPSNKLKNKSKGLLINDSTTLYDVLLQCAETSRKNSKPNINVRLLIGNLRKVLSKCCIKYLGADIFILDEFQKFPQLLKTENDGNEVNEVAKSIFNIPDAKVLMLSATPFKAFSTTFDELAGESHSDDICALLGFLNQDDKFEIKKYINKRDEYFSFLRKAVHLNLDTTEVKKTRTYLHKVYRRNIIRTERDNRDSIISDVMKHDPIQVQKIDVQNFVAVDRMILSLNEPNEKFKEAKNGLGFVRENLPVPLEYGKSAPFSLSYLDNYQHGKLLSEIVEKPSYYGMTERIKENKEGWLNYKNIASFLPLGRNGSELIPNPKIRLLVEKTLENGWKYLWIPPIAQYYKPEGPYKDSEGFSKVLVFSSWTLVPKMISTLLSYELERVTIGKLAKNEKETTEPSKFKYFNEKRENRYPRQLLTFYDSRDNLSMRNFIYAYPSQTLADIFDPSQFVGQKITIKEIKKIIKDEICNKFESIYNKYKNGRGRKDIWYWAAPILLDREISKKSFEWIYNSKEEDNFLGNHYQRAITLIKTPVSKEFDFPELLKDEKEDVLEFLTNLALGSSSICALRSFSKLFKTDDNKYFSHQIGLGFLKFFDKPENIAIVRLTALTGSTYLEKVLSYSIDGNIQSMLDEYFYILNKIENRTNPKDLFDHLNDMISLRTASLGVKMYDDSAKNQITAKNMRIHFAVHFGTQLRNDDGGTNREVNVKDAFNSPFRPFVLATTSIGQEGLDFHLYCRKIFHWNIPSNPIDFEQREGRITRYLGHAIRSNIAIKYLDKVSNVTQTNLWQELIKIAKESEIDKKSDIVPFWNIKVDKNYSIERYVPKYLYTKDEEKYRRVLEVLTYYRLTFGQPRQEELIDALSLADKEKDFIDELNKLMIDLSPISFNRESS